LDRNRLGGIGGSLASEIVATPPIVTAPATYPGGEGGYVAFPALGAHCPDSPRGDALPVFQIRSRPPPPPVARWVGAPRGRGFTDCHDNRRPLEPDRLDPRRRKRQSAARLPRRYRRAAVRRRQPAGCSDRIATFPEFAGRRRAALCRRRRRPLCLRLLM